MDVVRKEGIIYPSASAVRLSFLLMANFQMPNSKDAGSVHQQRQSHERPGSQASVINSRRLVPEFLYVLDIRSRIHLRIAVRAALTSQLQDA